MTGATRHPTRWVALGVLVVVAALVAVLAASPNYQTRQVANASIGHVVPLAGPTLTGSGFDLTAERGRWVVVNFFASWCGPCQQEEPELVTFAFEHRAPTDTALVGVVVDDSDTAARTYQQQQGATWPTLADPDGSLGVRWAVLGQPETFLVDPQGVVVAHIDGPVTAAYLDRELTAFGAPT